MEYRFRVSRPRQSQTVCRVGRRAYYCLVLGSKPRGFRDGCKYAKITVNLLHSLVARELTAAAAAAAFSYRKKPRPKIPY